MPSLVRRILQLWWLTTTPLLVAGVATARVGLARDDLLLMLWGIGLSTPFLMGVYAIIGAISLWGIAILVRILPRLPGILAKQQRENRRAVQPPPAADPSRAAQWSSGRSSVGRVR